jgi:hypothetical protein
MGYYWNAIDERWDAIDHGRQLTAKQRRRIQRRKQLIADLITEVKVGRDAVTRLYANLLLRALVLTDEELMRSHGKEVAELSPKEKVRKAA